MKDGFPDPVLSALPPLCLTLAALASPIWADAGLTLGLTLLVPGNPGPGFIGPPELVQAPLVLACRSWPGWRWGWLSGPAWFLDPWSWLCRCWLRWPWLCWSWLRYPPASGAAWLSLQASPKPNAVRTREEVWQRSDIEWEGGCPSPAHRIPGD